MTRTLWCEWAWMPDGPRRGVRLSTEHGVISAVATGARPGPDDVPVEGMVVSGAANCHSHAFHRCLRGAGVEGDSFWSWRTSMYRVAERLTPESYHDLALGVFAEMVAGGYTSVGEFHYVHHRADGSPHDDPNAMGEALIAAAREAGIRLTLLDTCYLSSGFGSPLLPEQARFGDRDVHTWRRRVTELAARHHGDDDIVIGAAIHSVRAVDPQDMEVVARWASDNDAPLHVHLSEQVRENSDCVEARGVSPTEVLRRSRAWEANATAVHATHLSDEDVTVLGEHGVTCCFCPSTEADLADGIGPALALAGAGASLTLGSDQDVLADPFAEARALEMDQRLTGGSRENFTPGELMDALTVNGQRSLGWRAGGRIVTGALADLVQIRMDTASLAGVLPERVPSLASRSDIGAVWVAGTRRAQNGRHLTIDTAGVLRDAIGALRDAS